MMKEKNVLNKLIFAILIVGLLSIGNANKALAARLNNTGYTAVPSNQMSQTNNTMHNFGEAIETIATDDGFIYKINEDGKTITLVSYLESKPNAKKDVVIPEEIDGYTITIIGTGAFNTSTITSVTIPETVIEIQNSAFSSCKDLKEVSLPESITKISVSTFDRCTSLEKITIPKSVKNIERHAFTYCSGLNEITFNEGLETIGDAAFHECTNLKKIVLPSSLTEIGNLEFWDCTNLTEINLPANLQIIGQQAFEGCKLLKKIVIPGKVEKLGLGIFKGCTELESVIIPKTVKEIGNIFLPSTDDLSEIEKTTITCASGSAAEAHAKYYNIKYIIDDAAPKLKTSITASNNNDNKIIATISSNEELQELEGWKISEDKKSMTKTYDSEPDEKVTVKDLVGNETNITVKIKGDGDLNNDNKITATDLIIMKRKIVKIVQTTAEDIKNGDLNGDGKITATDLLLLKKVIVGLV